MIKMIPVQVVEVIAPLAASRDVFKMNAKNLSMRPAPTVRVGSISIAIRR